jgi:hypothetical protein
MAAVISSTAPNKFSRELPSPVRFLLGSAGRVFVSEKRHRW